MIVYLYCNIGMYNNTVLSYSDYYTVLMLSVYMYVYLTRGIYIAVTFPYMVERGVTGLLSTDWPVDRSLSDRPTCTKNVHKPIALAWSTDRSTVARSGRPIGWPTGSTQVLVDPVDRTVDWQAFALEAVDRRPQTVKNMTIGRWSTDRPFWPGFRLNGYISEPL